MELYRECYVSHGFNYSLPRKGIGTSTYECAPSDRAMNGSSGHSFSEAGSEPSSTPIHVSISGPLFSSISRAAKRDPRDKSTSRDGSRRRRQ